MGQRSVLSVANIFASAHFFLIIYILAPYLATFMRPESTGLVVSFGAVITLALFPFMPRLVAKYGPQTISIALATLEGIFLVWLAADPAPIPAMFFAALACATSPLLAYQLDLMLEATVTNERLTGRVRTAFLTAGNAALIVTPLMIGLLLDGGDLYGRVFLTAALSLIPFILLMVMRPMPHALPGHTLTRVREAWLRVAGDRDLRAIASCMAVLQFFYHLAPLYIPLYLHTVLGIQWSELGWIFAIMLLPFVLVEYPAGVLADRFGDRAFLFLGFLVLGLSFAAILLIHASTPAAVIVLILIASRLGAALVEAMVEGHFFRRVSAEDAHTVSVFRMMRPIGALVAPLVGSMLLSVAGYDVFFFITGGLTTALGLMGALAIRDIR